MSKGGRAWRGYFPTGVLLPNCCPLQPPLPQEAKQAIHMSKGGRAWRGYFPTGEELTSGRPDVKEASGDKVQCKSVHKCVHPDVYIVSSKLQTNARPLFPT